MTDRYEKFSTYIASAYRYVQKLEREEMEKYGLKGSYAQYLHALKREPQGLTAVRICEICDKDKAAVSRAVTEMIDCGLITREGKNAYRAVLKLTEEGASAADFVSSRAEIAVKAAGNGLSDEHRAVFYASLEIIASNLQKICKEGIAKE